MTAVDFAARWRELDGQIKNWWQADLRQACEPELRDPALNQIWYADEEHRRREQQEGEAEIPTLLYLPFPFVAPGGSDAAFPEMYAWDAYFINLGLAAHGRCDLIRNHICNQLFVIERYGFLLTGNRVYYLSRSQTPLHPESVRLCHAHAPDRDLLARAYPVFKREYFDYWCAGHHQTPLGLATNRDLSDPALGMRDFAKFSLSATRLRPELAAEAETLDFTPIYAGDARACVPLQTNCALVRYAKTLAWMAAEIGWPEEAATWQAEAGRRAALIQKYCWNETEGFFFEYQFQRQQQLPFWSLCAYWAMWAGVATAAQAERLVPHLARFEQEHGLTQTDQPYPSPHPEFQALQFNYPNGWPPFQIMVIDALTAYGYHAAARRLAGKFLRLQLELYQTTGKLWEKYNVVAGNLDCPRERYPVVPLHGWSSATVAHFGRMLFETR